MKEDEPQIQMARHRRHEERIGRHGDARAAIVVSLYRCCTICGGATPEGKAMSTPAEWLASLGMSEYAGRFAENGIDVSVLRHVTDQDLNDIGVLLVVELYSPEGQVG